MADQGPQPPQGPKGPQPGMVQGKTPPEPPKAKAAEGEANPKPVTKPDAAPGNYDPSVPRPTVAAAQGQPKLSEESPAPVEAVAASAHPEEPAAGSETHDEDIPNASDRMATERVESLQYSEPMSDPTRDVAPVDVAEPAPHIAPPTWGDRSGTTQPIAPPPPMDAGQEAVIEHAVQWDANKPRVPEIPPDPDPVLVAQHLAQQRIGIDARPVVPVPHEVAVESQSRVVPGVDDEVLDAESQAAWDAMMGERDGRPSAKQAFLAGRTSGMARHGKSLGMADMLADEMEWSALNALPPRARGQSVLTSYRQARES